MYIHEHNMQDESFIPATLLAWQSVHAQVRVNGHATGNFHYYYCIEIVTNGNNSRWEYVNYWVVQSSDYIPFTVSDSSMGLVDFNLLYLLALPLIVLKCIFIVVTILYSLDDNSLCDLHHTYYYQAEFTVVLWIK